MISQRDSNDSLNSEDFDEIGPMDEMTDNLRLPAPFLVRQDTEGNFDNIKSRSSLLDDVETSMEAEDERVNCLMIGTGFLFFFSYQSTLHWLVDF